MNGCECCGSVEGLLCRNHAQEQNADDNGKLLDRIKALEALVEKFCNDPSGAPCGKCQSIRSEARALLPAPREEVEPVMYCTSPGHRTFNGGCWDCGRPKAAPLADGGKEGK